MSLITLSHREYVASRSYRRQAQMRKAASKPGASLAILHAVDDSCCLREPWATTQLFLEAALRTPGRQGVGLLLLAQRSETKP